jgi:hypothetical protein
MKIPYFSTSKNNKSVDNIRIMDFGLKTPLDKKKEQQAIRALIKSDAKLRKMGLR